MSQQVYANSQDKYSPQSAVNVFTLSANVVAATGANFAGLPATIPSNGCYWDKLNGQAVTRSVTAPTVGNSNYADLILGATAQDIMPISKNAGTNPTFAANGDTYFQVITSGSYTFQLSCAFGGPSGTNRLWEIGFLIADWDLPNASPVATTIEPRLYAAQAYWSATTGNVFSLYSEFTKQLKAGQLIKPVILTTDGYTLFADISTSCGSTYLQYYKN